MDVGAKLSYDNDPDQLEDDESRLLNEDEAKLLGEDDLDDDDEGSESIDEADDDEDQTNASNDLDVEGDDEDALFEMASDNALDDTEALTPYCPHGLMDILLPAIPPKAMNARLIRRLKD